MAPTTDPALLDGGRLLPLVEDFYTIQGEGFHAGKPAYFIRLGGCDVGCRWCDAKYTWNPKLYPPTDVRTVIDRATACPAQAIVITGGEPLLYPLGILTETLRAENAARVSEKCLLYLQPEWSVAERVMPAMVEYAKAHPRWNISIQTHKYMHIP